MMAHVHLGAFLVKSLSTAGVKVKDFIFHLKFT